MIKYNLVIIENKQRIPFLNLTEQAFYDKLWEWTYEDDDIDCFAFRDDGIIKEYQMNDGLYEFIYNKIKEHNERN